MIRHPHPDRILQLVGGFSATNLVIAAVDYGIFTLIEEQGASTVQALAAAAEVPQRGMQALLDGLVGLELLKTQDHRYSNTEEAAVFLVKTRASYLGDYVVLQKSMLERWVSLTDIVRHGSDTFISNIEDNTFWESVVRGIAPLMIPVAQQAAQTLNIASQGPCKVLDIGGGSGIYSGVWLALNPQAEVTQLDWQNVNQLARKHVARLGFADRFFTIDGDFHTTPFGVERFDVVIVSNIAHQETPEQCRELLQRVHKALRSEGRVVVSDLILNDDRSGPTLPLMFNSEMLVNTAGGASYCESEYRQWLSDARFRDLRHEATSGPFALIYASK